MCINKQRIAVLLDYYIATFMSEALNVKIDTVFDIDDMDACWIL